MRTILIFFFTLMWHSSSVANVNQGGNKEITEALDEHVDDFRYFAKCSPFYEATQDLTFTEFPITCVGKVISYVSVYLNGETASTLNESELTSFVRMRAKNDLGFLEQESMNWSEALDASREHYPKVIESYLEQMGVPTYQHKSSLEKLQLYCHVWTVGTSSPIAMHTSCELSSLLFDSIVGIGRKREPISAEVLSVTSDAESTVEESLRVVITQIAKHWVEEEEFVKRHLNKLRTDLGLTNSK